MCRRRRYTSSRDVAKTSKCQITDLFEEESIEDLLEKLIVLYNSEIELEEVIKE